MCLQGKEIEQGASGFRMFAAALKNPSEYIANTGILRQRKIPDRFTNEISHKAVPERPGVGMNRSLQIISV